MTFTYQARQRPGNEHHLLSLIFVTLSASSIVL